jgi:quercetin dioxygenase-like cupin family protein
MVNSEDDKANNEKGLNSKPWSINSEDLQETTWPYCTIRHFPSAGKTLRISEVKLQPNNPAPVIRHDRSTELARIIKGDALVYLGGKVSIERAGSTFYIPPGTTHGFKALNGMCLLLVVHVPAEPPNKDHTIIYEDFDFGSQP